AGSGMGRTLAASLAGRGCHLAISDVNEIGLAETARSCAERGVKVTSKKVDVASRDQVYAWADEVVRDHGRCNLIFNNAGVAHSATVEGVSYEDFDWIFGINFWGVVYGTKAFLPHLKAAGEGHVINTSSLFGLIGVPTQATYNATKFAVRGFTEALREELEMTRSPVSATCVHPGGIKTNIARAARVSESVKSIGVKDVEKGRESFERMFRVTAEDAAETILRGVQRNARRVLIGADARFLDVMQRLIPGSYHGLVAAATRRAMSRV
ncbi:MAG TPA: SDR family oxidoreductase, partial [Polyangiaceae bacterium]|nr:SDR family oxidoreductase [Polyangiaceae bacterium]